MKKILKLLVIILGIILIKFIFTFFLNEIIIWNYNNDRYNDILIKLLYPLNYNQTYIVYYNNGNILYRKEKYTEAIERYNKAIDKKPPQNRICDVRINLALAMIKEIDNSFDYKTAYNQLESAKDNLYNNNCANPIDNSGYSEEAEKLEEEIKELQKNLNKTSNNNPTPTDNNGNNDPEDTNIQDKLNDINKRANENRQSDMTTYENMGNGSSYSGKRW